MHSKCEIMCEHTTRHITSYSGNKPTEHVPTDLSLLHLAPQDA